ncbi:uncharacterized protein LOC117243297 [Bombus vosnesenskii]|uniref:Uncharacterized protein LOC117243297 n=1 Tax=Bombus vosnesenskii TaxID=207650 RepID=A0A6J3LP88_9HYME|nr:uncharacterized protein LOC117243297 [Bombus vosnesenskii]
MDHSWTRGHCYGVEFFFTSLWQRKEHGSHYPDVSSQTSKCWKYSQQVVENGSEERESVEFRNREANWKLGYKDNSASCFVEVAQFQRISLSRIAPKGGILSEKAAVKESEVRSCPFTTLR